jgi:hypothetical protein
MVRLTKLELLDELEEFNLLLQHYCIAWGTTAKEVDSQEKLMKIKW